MPKVVGIMERESRILIGDASGAKVEAATGIPDRRIRDWKQHPERITLEGAIRIANGRGLTDREILAIFKR